MDEVARRHLREAAEIIARQARINAAVFSRRIPAATYVKGADWLADTYAEVVTDHRAAPSAAPNQYAEKHPLFGDREHWYKMPSRPYMTDAVRERVDEAVEKFAETVDEWARDLGYRE